MFETKRSGRVGYEDLLREFNAIEQSLIAENSALAMSLMVLEAKVQERFQKLEDRAMDRPFFADDVDQLSPSDIKALIPCDIPQTHPLVKKWGLQRSTHALETVGMAALLAVVTALGVFGLAALTQLVLSWVI